MMTGTLLRDARAILFMVSLVLGAGCGGCIIHGRFVHDPPLARNVPRLVRGKTTQSQVIEHFGIPDLEARGSVVVHHLDGPMGRYYQKMKQSHETLSRMAERYGNGGDATKMSGAEWLDEWLGLRAYSSINDDHVAYLYEETDGSCVWGVTYGLPVMVGGSDIRIRQNRLLILLNKHTGVVDEFGYHQEFKAR